MFFALPDLLRYRFRLGHYGDDPSKNILALGHTDRVEEETLKVLAEGDIIICQRMDSLLSWAIMYFGGRYAVDHVAIYLGEGKVLHATLSGVKEHSIHALARGARILPFRLHELDKADPSESPRHNPENGGDGEDRPDKAGDAVEHARAPSPHLQLLLVGIEVVLGLRPTSFRWQYYLDIGFVAVLVDLLLWPINHFPMACTIWSAWLLVLIYLRIRFRMHLRAGRKFEPDSHPGLIMGLMWSQGGYIFPREPAHGRRKIRVWTAWEALSLQRQIEPQLRNQQSDQGNSASDR